MQGAGCEEHVSEDGKEQAGMKELDRLTVQKVLKAVQTIQDGVCKRVDVSDGIKVYACKNIIRIDIKYPND